MYRCIIFFAILAVAFGSAIKLRVPLLDGRIVGGKDTSIEKHPYQVSVRIFGEHGCGGSILNSRTVLTAAHCIMFNWPSCFTVEYGTTKIGGSANVVSVKKIERHEKYDSGTVDYDVALLFLSEEIIFGSNAQPVKLATSSPAPGSQAVVTGWGALKEGGASPTILQKVNVDIVNSKECKKQYKDINEITEQMLCAAVNGGGRDACQGDSGGPLVCKNELVGVVSWGLGCGRPDFAGVYSNVPKLLPWIESNVKTYGI